MKPGGGSGQRQQQQRRQAPALTIAEDQAAAEAGTGRTGRYPTATHQQQHELLSDCPEQLAASPTDRFSHIKRPDACKACLKTGIGVKSWYEDDKEDCSYILLRKESNCKECSIWQCKHILKCASHLQAGGQDRMNSSKVNITALSMSPDTS